MRATTRGRHAVLLGALVACTAAAGLRADDLTWLGVAADAPIDHAVMVRGPFADTHAKAHLVGPVAVVASGSGAGPCFTVYAATAGGDEPERTAWVGVDAVPLRLGPPAFLLVPARRLRDGEPATEAPRGVYEARPVLDPPRAFAGAPAEAGPPTHLCLPVDYRHHFERVPVEAADRGFVIFAARDAAVAATQAEAPVAVADDFGLAHLVPRGDRRDGVWLPVRTAAPR